MAAANVFDPELGERSDREGFRHRGAALGAEAGSERLGASIYELEPGQASSPYHWHAANEELLMLIEGKVELRTPDGTRELDPGEVVAFPRGERGAHQVINRGEEPARFLILSEMNYPDICRYPDSDKVGVRDRHPASAGDPMVLRFVAADAVDYFHGEERE